MKSAGCNIKGILTLVLIGSVPNMALAPRAEQLGFCCSIPFLSDLDHCQRSYSVCLLSLRGRELKLRYFNYGIRFLAFGCIK